MPPTTIRIQADSSNLWSKATQLADEMFLQEQLGELCANFIDFEDPGSHGSVVHMHHFELALKYSLRIKLALEIEDLPDFKVSGTQELATAVAHVLKDTWEMFISVAQRPSSGYRNP